ncbi:hypothetical protein CC1G_05389 [Coprinopsis cinerea okayama7|uniref:Dockerin type 1 n=1 Tax=Coprinopsis cinerea (strain Okayama-7 / 130 / ATCC MYA-4618 / FGSC 9003) TaxID=240176 RepID=A8NPX6_COPC7|nr:hypothetical protein CC1G_05389 [Coprinopsis cinerea okayama7\|eukprot:XP_001835427.1 hypothetical protein CC1G_05389 [Coprinopsis cinerea okayama7\
MARFSLLATLGLFLGLVWTALAAPRVSQIGNSLLDNNGIYFVSYDGLVNVNSFQLSNLLTYGNYQYAAWYTSSRFAILARRQLPNGGWQTLQLPRQLSSNNSHNVVVIGISPEDGRIHVALDCHSSRVFYTVSEPGLAFNGNLSWVSSRFGGISNNLGNLNVGTQVTYPQFVVTPDNLLQFVYRSGVSGNGATQLAEYRNGVWTNVGSWATNSGSYSARGVTSNARNLYIHGFTYRNGRLHVTGTWREQAGGVMCNGGGLTNHDTVYFYSDDRGRNWRNSGGAHIATSGSNPVRVSSPGIIVDPINADHGLMNQESQDVDSQGQIHAIISYVPGRFTQCVTSYQRDRTSYARPFHVFRSPNGSFTKREIPFALNAVGRSQIVIDKNDDIYVVLPFVRVVSASKSSGYTDWTMVFDGVAQGLNAFGEVTVDRARMREEGILSVFYQLRSSGNNPSQVRVIDFALNT